MSDTQENSVEVCNVSDDDFIALCEKRTSYHNHLAPPVAETPRARLCFQNRLLLKLEEPE